MCVKTQSKYEKRLHLFKTASNMQQLTNTNKVFFRNLFLRSFALRDRKHVACSQCKKEKSVPGTDLMIVLIHVHEKQGVVHLTPRSRFCSIDYEILFLLIQFKIWTCGNN